MNLLNVNARLPTVVLYVTITAQSGAAWTLLVDVTLVRFRSARDIWCTLSKAYRGSGVLALRCTGLGLYSHETYSVRQTTCTVVSVTYG